MDDLSEIARIFVEFENADDPEHRIKKFKAGVDQANECLVSLDAGEANDRRLKNLKLSYTRILLAYLSTLSAVPFTVWFDYIVVLLTDVSAEVEQVLELHPALREGYDDFIKLHREELRRIAKLSGHAVKS